MKNKPRAHPPLYRVTAFEVVAPYALRVEFDDGTAQVIDFEPILCGNWFGPLRDLALFNQVRLDSEVHTLVWPNDADFEPATLHDWPLHLAELKARARRWAKTEIEDDWVSVKRMEATLAQYGPFKSLADLAKQEQVPLSTLAQAAREGRLPAVALPTGGWMARASAVKNRLGLRSPRARPKRTVRG